MACCGLPLRPPTAAPLCGPLTCWRASLPRRQLFPTETEKKKQKPARRKGNAMEQTLNILRNTTCTFIGQNGNDTSAYAQQLESGKHVQA
eukprot:11182583-Lingulodinium_polyedra.AAC.1